MDPAPSVRPEVEPPEPEVEVLWVPVGRRLLSGVLGVNLVVLGASCVAARAVTERPQLFVLLLLLLSLLWLLWVLLWARRRCAAPRTHSGTHTDPHAAGTNGVLLLFATCTSLLCVCRTVYLMSVRECRPAAALLSPFVQTAFVLLQTYFLWVHSKDCIHHHKNICRSGLMVVLSSDLLLWFSGLVDDSIHLEIESEKMDRLLLNTSAALDSAPTGEPSVCRCSSSATCLIFRKGLELLFPFQMEFHLMAACLVYVMWKNVGRRPTQTPPSEAHKLNLLHLLRRGRTLSGLLVGLLVLVVGVVVFVLYQTWVGQPGRHHTAFVSFYAFHLCVTPLMCASSLTGVVLHRLEKRQHDSARNPTRSLDVTLLLVTAVGQLALGYLSLVAAIFLKSSRSLRGLEVSYSVLSLLELVLQNIFIINGLHRPHGELAPQLEKKKESESNNKQEPCLSLMEADCSAPPAAREDGVRRRRRSRRIMQEICVFLILANITMWLIPAFGAHPQLENGLGKQFFGFGAWLVLVNLFQPLAVFYRMHSVGALMELLAAA